MDIAICLPAESEYFGKIHAPVIGAIQRANDACLKLISAAKEKAIGQNENVLWMLAASCLMSSRTFPPRRKRPRRRGDEVAAGVS
jgi:hypothetical protein